MQAARRSPRSVAVDEIQQEVGLPHVTAGRRAVIKGSSASLAAQQPGLSPVALSPGLHVYASPFLG
jgi:hypothetical protein